MPITHTPTKSDALLTTFTGIPFDDPVDYSAPHNRRIDAKFFLKPIQDELLKLIDIAIHGGGALKIRNETGLPLPAGPIRITGYSPSQSVFLVAAASATGTQFAHLLLLESLAINTTGLAYRGGTLTAALNTSGAAIGDPVYLSTSGTLTLSAPSGANEVAQIIGRVATVAASGDVAAFILEPQTHGTSQLQSSAVTEAKLSTSVAGNGLSGGAGSALAVNVDNATVEISSDTVRVKDAGITLDKLEPRARPTPTALANGGFDLFQRQTPGSTASRADDTYGPDRWYVLTQTAAINIERSAGDTRSRFAAKLTQPQASAQRMGLAQIVEGLNSIPFRGRTVRFQARVKCSSSQPIRCAIVEHTGTIDSITSDIVNDWTSSNYTDGAARFFVDSNLLPAGTGSVTPSAATWTDLSVNATLSTSLNNAIVFIWTEGAAAQNVTLEITEAGLYDGASARDWLPRPAAEELALCQRFFRKSYDIDTAPATATNNGKQDGVSNGNLNRPIASWPVSPPMRAVPTCVFYSSNSGASGKCYDGSGDQNANANPLGQSMVAAYCAATVASNTVVAFHYTADAEL